MYDLFHYRSFFYNFSSNFQLIVCVCLCVEMSLKWTVTRINESHRAVQYYLTTVLCSVLITVYRNIDLDEIKIKKWWKSQCVFYFFFKIHFFCKSKFLSCTYEILNSLNEVDERIKRYLFLRKRKKNLKGVLLYYCFKGINSRIRTKKSPSYVFVLLSLGESFPLSSC